MAAHSSVGELGSEIIDFTLPATDGRIYSVSDFHDKDLLVIVFKCNHCPYVKAVVSRLVELQKKYSGRGVQFIGINSNDAETYPEDSFENMKLFSNERGINFPYLYDESQEVAKAYDAVCTPDIYVYDNKRKLRYRGRLDDSWKDESAVGQRDLAAALEAILEKRPVQTEQFPAMGCSIKWKP